MTVRHRVDVRGQEQVDVEEDDRRGRGAAIRATTSSSSSLYASRLNEARSIPGRSRAAWGSTLRTWWRPTGRARFPSCSTSAVPGLTLTAAALRAQHDGVRWPGLSLALVLVGCSPPCPSLLEQLRACPCGNYAQGSGRNDPYLDEDGCQRLECPPTCDGGLPDFGRSEDLYVPVDLGPPAPDLRGDPQCVPECPPGMRCTTLDTRRVSGWASRAVSRVPCRSSRSRPKVARQALSGKPVQFGKSTWTGRGAVSKLPLPTLPDSFLPQHHSAPLRVMAHAKSG